MGLLMDILLIILAIILPPIPVFLRTGCSQQLLLCIILTLLGWIPGASPFPAAACNRAC